MTLIRVSLKTAIKMALLLYPDLPKWKTWRLRHPGRDKQQRKVTGGKRRLNRAQLTNGGGVCRGVGVILPPLGGIFDKSGGFRVYLWIS